MAAGAGLAVVPIQADEKGRTGEFLGDAAGHDANHALVPALVGQDDGLRRLSGGQHLNGLAVDFRLHGLALAVELAQGLGKLRGPAGVVGEKQLHSQINLAHPPGGVDSGGQHKADGGGADGFRGAAALGHEGGDARPAGVGQGVKAPGDEHPVFPQQGHHVGHGAQAHHVGVFFQHLFLAAAEGGGQLEGHTHAGEHFVGIAAVGAVGVHHGHSLGEGVLAFVMVGDDQVDSQLPAQCRLLHGGDAAVHGDDELHALAGELPDGDGVQAVALLQTAGDVAAAVGALLSQVVRQQAGGGDAVHVVVAENGDFLPTAQGQSHPAGGQVHVRHPVGVRQGGVAV